MERRHFAQVVLSVALSLAGSSCQSRAASGREAGEAQDVSRLPTAAFVAPGNVTMADVAERSLGSVVNVLSERTVTFDHRNLGPFFNDPLFREFFGDRLGGIPHERLQRSLGSGVILSRDGVVVTNHHVVDKAEKLRVGIGPREYEVDVVGSDPGTDIAVVRIKNPPKDLTPLEFGDSNRLRLGDVVLAIGNPYGVGQTVTMGIASAKGRANIGIVDFEDFIQTDAAINPGNSGGALINMEGKVIGINTAIVSRSGGYQGIGFAVPSNMVKLVMDEVMTTGKVSRGWLGVMIQDVDDALARALKLPTSEGVLVSDVTADGPAAKAGIQRGDLITRVAGKATESSSTLKNTIAALKPAVRVDVTLFRAGKQMTLKVQLAEKPDVETPASKAAGEPSSPLAGLTLAPLNKIPRRRLNIPDSVTHGLVVTAVKTGSPGAQAGLRPGDVILEANRTQVKSIGDLRTAVRDDAPVALLVQRGDISIFVLLQPNSRG